jgi:rhamnose utilization protein RhaD (predicted bifunctional aldolase and dehydrogenase)
MESKYEVAEAARVVSARPPHVSEALALRTYTARLLGSDPSLVLSGGGNTSVKAHAIDAFGETVDVLHVKGSGWDLATIEPPGHPAVRLSHLARLVELPALSDEQMVNAMRLALLDASAPTPSVETLLHSALPARYIDHTHADAILAVADQPNGELVCREIFRERLLWVPYIMPGFGLAKACKKAWDGAIAAGRRPTVMILERHGIFTFGETAKESYERMIDAVTLAERYAADRRKTTNVPAVYTDASAEARACAILRGVLAAVSRARRSLPSARARRSSRFSSGATPASSRCAARRRPITSCVRSRFRSFSRRPRTAMTRRLPRASRTKFTRTRGPTIATSKRCASHER